MAFCFSIIEKENAIFNNLTNILRCISFQSFEKYDSCKFFSSYWQYLVILSCVILDRKCYLIYLIYCLLLWTRRHQQPKFKVWTPQACHGPAIPAKTCKSCKNLQNPAKPANPAKISCKSCIFLWLQDLYIYFHS